MKRIAIIILTSLLTMTAFADSAKDARKILDKTAALITKSGGAKASFSISGGKVNQAGTIAIKGNKFCATTPAATMWYDGKTQWTYVKANNEVNVATPNAAKQQQMNPYSFLTLYKKGYNLSVSSKGNQNVVHMKAQGKANIQEAYVTIDSRGYPVQVRLNQGGKWMTIAIKDFKPAKLADSYFVFNSKDYPKAEIIDLR